MIKKHQLKKFGRPYHLRWMEREGKHTKIRRGWQGVFFFFFFSNIYVYIYIYQTGSKFGWLAAPNFKNCSLPIFRRSELLWGALPFQCLGHCFIATDLVSWCALVAGSMLDGNVEVGWECGGLVVCCLLFCFNGFVWLVVGLVLHYP